MTSLYSGVSRTVHRSCQDALSRLLSSLQFRIRHYDITHLTANLADNLRFLRRFCSFSLSNIGAMLPLAFSGPG